MGPALLTVLLPLLLGVSGSFLKHSSSTEKKPQSVCGLSPYTSQILGSHDALKGHWPWIISIRLGFKHICGGSLINQWWILTSATCLEARWTIYVYTVWLASIKADDSHKDFQYHVSKIIIHPNYKENTADIALMRLSSPVNFTSVIKPVCLPIVKEEHLMPPNSCWLSSFWKSQGLEDTDFYSILHEATLPIIYHKACSRIQDPIGSSFPGREPAIKEDSFCVNNTERMKNNCKGFSGGPLVCYFDDVWIQVGVVSRGVGCQNRLPGVYTNVLYYQKWINDTISRAEVLGSKNLKISHFLLPTGLLSLVLLGPSSSLWV